MPRINFVKGNDTIFTHKLPAGKTCPQFAGNLLTVRNTGASVDVGGWIFNRGDWDEIPAGTYRIEIRNDDGTLACQANFVKN